MRDAVWTLLGTDPVLNADPYRILQENVHTTFGMDGSRVQPNIGATGYFIVLRWEEEVNSVGLRTVLSVWVHRARAKGSDFVEIRKILDRINFLMTNTFHRVGADGGKMTMAHPQGRGADQVDQGYDTIAKYAVFDVLSGETLNG